MFINNQARFPNQIDAWSTYGKLAKTSAER